MLDEKLLLDDGSILKFKSPLGPGFRLKPSEAAGTVRIDDIGRISMGGQEKRPGRGADPGFISVDEDNTIGWGSDCAEKERVVPPGGNA
jgi:hypothetical protein